MVPLQAQSPRNDVDALWDTHGQEHFWPKNTAIADFKPLAEALVVGENFHAWFSVGIIGGLEAEFFDAKLLEKLIQYSYEVA